MRRRKLAAHEVLRALMDVGEVLGAVDVELDDGLRQLLQTVVDLVGCDRCSLFTWDGVDYCLAEVVDAEPGSATTFEMRVAEGGPLLAQARENDGLLVVNHATRHPILGPMATAASFESIVIAVVDDNNGRPLAFVTADCRRGAAGIRRVDAEVVGGAAMLARGALIAQRFRLARAASERARREMLARLADAESRERRRIGHDIHDDVLQRVSALSHFLESEAVAEPDDARRARFERLHGEARAAALALRGIVMDLDPVDVESTSLRSILDGLVFVSNARHSGTVELTTHGDEPTPADVATAVHLIARQAVDNALAHAGADHIQVVLDARDGRTVLSVSDGGCGFDPAAVSTGIGLFSMVERAQQLGGSCVINSTIGHGSEIVVAIPHVRPAATEHGQI